MIAEPAATAWRKSASGGRARVAARTVMAGARNRGAASSELRALTARAVRIAVVCAVLLLVLSGCAAISRNVEVGAVFRDPLRDGGAGPEMVWLPAGSFDIGDLHGDGDFDEKPVHRVTVRAPLAVSRYEITLGEFRQFVAATSYVTEAERDGGCMIQGGKNWREPKYSQTDDHPVICVSWNDAHAYLQWLSGQTGKRYRLPTEAEWEYAARGGTATRWSWGDQPLPQRANCWGCVPPEMFHWTLPVGSFPPNAFGLHDMEGNVWEWTASEWSETYRGLDEQPSTFDGNSGTRAIRGGGWFNGPPDIRPANRGGVPPNDRYNTMGIRVVRDAD